MKGSRWLHAAAAVLLALVFAAPLSAQAADTGLVEGETNVQLIFKMGTTTLATKTMNASGHVPLTNR